MIGLIPVLYLIVAVACFILATRLYKIHKSTTELEREQMFRSKLPWWYWMLGIPLIILAWSPYSYFYKQIAVIGLVSLGLVGYNLKKRK